MGFRGIRPLDLCSQLNIPWIRADSCAILHMSVVPLSCYFIKSEDPDSAPTNPATQQKMNSITLLLMFKYIL